MAASRVRQRFWPAVVIGLIGTNVLIVGVTVFAATARSGSFAVESDYDRKALHWDDTAKQIENNLRLGWTVKVDSASEGKLQVSLTDRQRRALEAATVSVEAFHHAHARDKFIATLTAVAPGEYAATLPIENPGLWEFRFVVTRGPETFTQSVTHLVRAAEHEVNQ